MYKNKNIRSLFLFHYSMEFAHSSVFVVISFVLTENRAMFFDLVVSLNVLRMNIAPKNDADNRL